MKQMTYEEAIEWFESVTPYYDDEEEAITIAIECIKKQTQKMSELMFIKLTPTPYDAKRLMLDNELWVNASDISVMAEYETHTAIHTKSGVYGVRESPKEIVDIINNRLE